MPRSIDEILAHADTLSAHFEQDFEPTTTIETDPLDGLRRAVIELSNAQRNVVLWVADARDTRCSWDSIGKVLGTSGQAARERYGSETDERNESRKPPTRTRIAAIPSVQRHGRTNRARKAQPITARKAAAAGKTKVAAASALKPGDVAPESGLVAVVGPRGGRTGEERSVQKGKILPPTPKPGQFYVPVRASKTVTVSKTSRSVTKSKSPKTSKTVRNK